MMQHSEWEDNPTPCCDCCEKITDLENQIRDFRIKLTVAYTTGGRLEALAKKLDAQIKALLKIREDDFPR